jgi:hypothetical protein
VLADVLSLIEGKPSPVPIPDACLAYLREHRIPEDIVRDLRKSSYPQWITIGKVSLLPMPNLISDTSGITECIEHGYLPLAGCANGDPVALDRESRHMVYVSHDILWDREWKEFGECVHRTPLLYEDFWEAVLVDRLFPRDYYEAIKFWQAGG